MSANDFNDTNSFTSSSLSQTSNSDVVFLQNNINNNNNNHSNRSSFNNNINNKRNQLHSQASTTSTNSSSSYSGFVTSSTTTTTNSSSSYKNQIHQNLDYIDENNDSVPTNPKYNNKVLSNIFNNNKEDNFEGRGFREISIKRKTATAQNYFTSNRDRVMDPSAFLNSLVLNSNNRNQKREVINRDNLRDDSTTTSTHSFSSNPSPSITKESKSSVHFLSRRRTNSLISNNEQTLLKNNNNNINNNTGLCVKSNNDDTIKRKLSFNLSNLQQHNNSIRTAYSSESSSSHRESKYDLNDDNIFASSTKLAAPINVSGNLFTATNVAKLNFQTEEILSIKTLSAELNMNNEVTPFGDLQIQLIHNEEDQQLIVKVVQARNLIAKDTNGFSDPFVKIYLLPGRE